MSEEFTASNGLVFVPKSDGSVRWEAGNSPVAVTKGLREFFLHERDQELGRWRWPENPEYVAYDLGVRVVRITHEPTGNSWDLDEFSLPNHIVGGRQSWHRTAQAYFAAHPLPKPWHDAKPGEVWAISHAAGGETAWTVDAEFISGQCTFMPVMVTDPDFVGMAVTAPGIKSARRVWPEAVES